MESNSDWVGSEGHLLPRGARCEARYRRPRCVHAHSRADPQRHPPPRCRAGSSSSRRPTWSFRSGPRSRRPGRRRRRGRRSGPAPGRPVAPAPGQRGDAGVPRGGERPPGGLWPGRVPAQHVQRRGLPAVARNRCLGDDTVSADSLLATLGSVGRAVSRDEARPVLTGILSVRRGQARDGGDRLLPALVQGDAGRGQRSGDRGDRPGACARGAQSPGQRRRHARARRPGEPGALRGRRHLADDAPHRGPVPEVRRAAAEGVHPRGGDCRATSCSRSFAARR